MNDYVQFVVCQQSGNSKKYLFYAPAFSNLKKGDEVLVDTQFGKQRATVVETCDAIAGSDVEKTLRALTGANKKPVKRVIGVYQKLDYEIEDETNE